MDNPEAARSARQTVPMRPLTPLPGLSGRPRSVAEFRAAGVPRWRLYADDVDHPLHGVVTRRGATSGADPRVEALRLALGPGQFFSRRTAARLHDIPVRQGKDPGLIEVGALRPLRPPRRPQVSGHQLREGALRRVPLGPTWLPEIEDAWCLLAQVASREELLAAADYIVSGPSRYEPPLSTLDLLVAASRRFRGCTGAKLCAGVLPLVRTGVESPRESELRLVIVDAGFAEPVTACPVRVAGRTLHADLGYPELRIAIEYEGVYHFGRDAVEQARRDVARVRAMEAAGWRVLRATVHDLRDPRAFLSELAGAILRASRGE